MANGKPTTQISIYATNSHVRFVRTSALFVVNGVGGPIAIEA